MTTIDYKQKIKDYMNSSEVDILYKSMLNNLFPELKESEGEMIKKEITELVMQPTWKTEKEFQRRKELCAWLEKQGEQKSAEWSEEDEKLLDDAIGAVGAADYYTYDDKQEIKNWINSLKDRVQTQPKQEWSEEDEKMFNSALWHVKNSCGNGGKNSGEFEVYNWLKSLKERCTWKPSDNELKVLRLAAEKDGACLMGLYEQLKKLREE